MTLAADPGFSDAVTSGHRYGRQLFLCDGSTGAIIEQLPMDPNSALSVSGNLVRRSGTVVVPNLAGRYTPRSAGLIDFDKAYLLRYGIVTATAVLSCDQPLLYPDSDELDLGGRTVTVPVSDGMRIVGTQAVLTAPLSFVDGTSLDPVILAVLQAVGAPTSDAYYDFDDGGEHLVGDHGYEVGTSVDSILAELLTVHSLDLWAAPPLVYTLAPIPDASTAAPVATWALGSDVKLVGLRVQRQSLARNHAIIEGVDPYGNAFTTEVFDLNPLSPVMYGAPGIGDLPVHYKSDSIASDTQARQVGRGLLLRRGVQRTYVAQVPIDPSLDRRDVVRIIDPTTGTDTQVMLDSWSLPAAPGTQEITVIEQRTLS
jgi:hypothetical protein